MAHSTLLRTKLYIPPTRPGLIPRPRLIERLDEGLHRKLTLVSAPAGFGKTTLVSEWLRRLECPCAWLSLDAADNDPGRFMAYFIAALQTIEADIGKEILSALQSPQPPPTESILTVLINEIAATTQRFVLILDDYHFIEAHPIRKALAFLLDHLPGNLHLVIITRTNPPVALSRLRGRGQVNEIRVADLRFMTDEVTVFLIQVMGLELRLKDVKALENRTEGWIVGLQLAALALQGTRSLEDHNRSSGISSFVRDFTGSNRYVIDYLADEVLQQRPAGTRDFLLQISILDRLSDSLCNAVRFGLAETPNSSEGTAVTGQKNSQSMLESLEAANLFIVPLDDDRRWYRYHQLFTDLLRQRLGREQPDLVPTLHRRASQWYEQTTLCLRRSAMRWLHMIWNEQRI